MLPALQKNRISTLSKQRKLFTFLGESTFRAWCKKEAVLKSEFPEENGDIIIYSYFLSKEDGR